MTLCFQAIIRPQMAEQVFLDLVQTNVVQALIAEECQGSGTRSTGTRTEVELLPKVIIYGMVEDDDLQQVIDCVRAHASTGRSGDGKIFIYPISSEAE